jgi:hypothetical protein
VWRSPLASRRFATGSRHLGEPTEPPPLSPARGPPFFQSRALRRRLTELDGAARRQMQLFSSLNVPRIGQRLSSLAEHLEHGLSVSGHRVREAFRCKDCCWMTMEDHDDASISRSDQSAQHRNP